MRAAGAIALTFVAPAFADALPPDTEQCDPHAGPNNTPDPTKIGLACDITPGDPNTAKGTCHCSICTGLVYGDAGPDAHGPTGTVSFPCLECKPGTQENCTSCPEPDAGHDTCIDVDGGLAGNDAGPVGDDAGHALGADPAGQPGSGNSSSGGCSIGGTASAAAPWLLAGIVPLVMRRRRKDAAKK